jgi:hypothetical protein
MKVGLENQRKKEGKKEEGDISFHFRLQSSYVLILDCKPLLLKEILHSFICLWI